MEDRLDNMRFGPVAARYSEIQDDRKAFGKLAKELRKQAVRTVVSMGELFDVFPFECERSGRKLDGKPIPEPVSKGNCFVYRFDGLGRVIMVERMGRKQKKPLGISMYFYGENLIERLLGDGHEMDQVAHAYMTQADSDSVSRISEMFVLARYGRWHEICSYVDGRLDSISTCGLEASGSVHDGVRNTDERFSYDGNGELKQIVKSWESPGSQIEYSTEKIHFKKLRERLLESTLETLYGFREGHPDAKVTSVVLNAFTGYPMSNMIVNLDSEPDEDPEMRYAEWTWEEVGNYGIANFPLDDKQVRKVRKSIRKIADQVKERAIELFGKDVSVIVFDHDLFISVH